MFRWRTFCWISETLVWSVVTTRTRPSLPPTTGQIYTSLFIIIKKILKKLVTEIVKLWNCHIWLSHLIWNFVTSSKHVLYILNLICHYPFDTWKLPYLKTCCNFCFFLPTLSYPSYLPHTSYPTNFPIHQIYLIYPTSPSIPSHLTLSHQILSYLSIQPILSMSITLPILRGVSISKMASKWRIMVQFDPSYPLGGHKDFPNHLKVTSDVRGVISKSMNSV